MNHPWTSSWNPRGEDNELMNAACTHCSQWMLPKSLMMLLWNHWSHWPAIIRFNRVVERLYVPIVLRSVLLYVFNLNSQHSQPILLHPSPCRILSGDIPAIPLWICPLCTSDGSFRTQWECRWYRSPRVGQALVDGRYSWFLFYPCASMQEGSDCYPSVPSVQFWFTVVHWLLSTAQTLL